MLANVLRTSVASSVSIHIMRAFVVMKKYVSKSLLEQTYINNLVLKDSKRIDLIEETLSKFKEKSNHLFFSAKYLELTEKEKKHFSIEMIFNIYENDFKYKIINEGINNHLLVYDYCYFLINNE
ncbi:MAG: hypothetical protein J6K23_05815 [Bacilli bacterium]|nr:hypothetical protein [Bacilli bacterium]